MITKQDIAEIKKIIDKENYHGILRKVAGVYVDGTKNMVHRFSKSIHFLPDEEIFKYLKIADKIPNVKSYEDKTIELDFRQESVVPKVLRAIVETDLTQSVYLDELYERIIDHYEIENGFLILIFHGVYDVMKKTTDGNELDESEEVYDFLLCAICPVNWDKPGLKYDSGKICAKQLQEVVGEPETGFIWPAFEKRSANPNKCIFYCQKPKKPQHEVITETLDCRHSLTASEYRIKFEKIVSRAVFNCTAVGTAYSDTVLQRLNIAFSDIVATDEASEPDNASVLTDLNLTELCKTTGINEVLTDLLTAEFKKYFGQHKLEWPKVRWLYDPKTAALAKYNEKRKHLKTIMRQAMKVYESSGQQDLAQEINEMLEEMHDA